MVAGLSPCGAVGTSDEWWSMISQSLEGVRRKTKEKRAFFSTSLPSAFLNEKS